MNESWVFSTPSLKLVQISLKSLKGAHTVSVLLLPSNYWLSSVSILCELLQILLKSYFF